MYPMALSDAVLGNITAIYVAVIVAIKAYGLLSGRSFGPGFLLAASISAVAAVIFATLAWDVSLRAAEAVSRCSRGGGEDRSHHVGGICRGGICWHGVAVRSPASQVRFRLPQHIPYAGDL
ncbi:PREDICTED: uncharacterized protein LOC104811416 [Tarenaya hassleriana]|uniref:uncharacterized protein LOC104811416 n=1 Tax=Tarenaya hassleriana TaxID=28532 RepID=UPI00053C1DA1|nr:PREDICTED: uncharacterized protein LOC104811416 [Tarenaya hassleriana]